MAVLSTCVLGALSRALILAGICYGYPSMLNELSSRQIDPSQLAASYDYIVVGGGQSGIVIANRLSENSTKTVLIVEYGYLDNNAAQLDPSSATQYPARDLFNVTSANQPGLANQPSTVYAASVVGGGSTINGMLFDRGSAEDYNGWEKLNNTGWGWNGLLPYFKKSTTFTPPDPTLAATFNITYDLSVWGTSGPISASYPPFQWPGTKIQMKAWNEIGVSQPQDGGGGDAGALWITSAIDPKKITRSYARNKYWDPAASRSNLKLLTGYRVNEVIFNSAKRAESVNIQARGTANGAATLSVKANKEIIITAGWLHTPQVLQRSGVGPAALLQQAGITVVSDLPGVGSNLQDHAYNSISYTYTKDTNPNPSSMYTDFTFQQQAQQQWTQNRTGPLSLGVGSTAAMVPLPIASTNWQTIVNKLTGQSAASYLPKSYTAAQVAGFTAQRQVLAAQYSSAHSAVMEIPFSGGASTALVLEKPVSRGVVGINVQDKYAEPTVDFNTLINPVDLDIAVETVKFTRKWFAAPSHQQLGPQESTPGTNIKTDAQIQNFVRTSMGSSTAHGCCTAAMQPQALGGVVGPDLLVYGVTGLSVADASLMPIIPATHLCATIYATAEKAADIIKARA